MNLVANRPVMMVVMGMPINKEGMLWLQRHSNMKNWLMR